MLLRSTRNCLFTSSVLILLFSPAVPAVPVIAASSGLASPTAVFDFDNPPPTNGPNQTGGVASTNGNFNANTYPGITLGGGADLNYNPGSPGFFNASPQTGFSGSYIATYKGISGAASTNSGRPFIIAFATPVDSALVAILTDSSGFGGLYTMSAFLAGNLVESFNFSSNVGSEGGFFGFQNVAGGFDALQITSPNPIARYDNLQYALASVGAPEIDPGGSRNALVLAALALAMLSRRRPSLLSGQTSA